MSKNCTLEEIAGLFLKNESFVLCPHVSPDGDALGSTLALKMALEKAGKQVTVMVDDDVPKEFGFLPQLDSFVKPDVNNPVVTDLLIVLDASSLDTEAAATGEILCALVEKLDVTPDKDLATCLYTAIYTDCGSFRFANTTPATMRAAAKLLEYGARPNEISDALGTHTRANIEMLGKVLQTLSFYNDGAVSTIEIIEGVDVAVLFKAVEPSVTRVSMRSQKTDVAEIALSFGGGGHIRAAGCTVELPLAEAKQKVLEAIGKAL